MSKILSFYEMAGREKITVVDYPLEFFRSVFLRLGGKDYIGIDPDLTKTQNEEMEALGHELGHYFTGAIYDEGASNIQICRAEHRANKWFIQQAVPIDELKRMLRRGVRDPWELAEHFEVSEDVIKKAFDLYSLLNY